MRSFKTASLVELFGISSAELAQNLAEFSKFPFWSFINPEKIELGKLPTQFCKKNHIARLSFFGSVLSDQFRPDSDVDVLVEFRPGKTPGFLGFSKMERDLSAILGRRVDLRTPGELSKYFREEVLSHAEVGYAG